jgi:hypothetical protein
VPASPLRGSGHFRSKIINNYDPTAKPDRRHLSDYDYDRAIHLLRR